MKLFDDRHRKSLAAAAPGEPEFPYLNEKSARPEAQRVRSALEEWFLHYPDAHKEELRSRLRAKKDYAFESAFFELLMHEFLWKLKCTVDAHVTVSEGNEKKIEFIAKPRRSAPFYMEAKLVTTKTNKEFALDKIKNDVLTAIDRLNHSNFRFDVSVKGQHERQPSSKAILSWIINNVSKLDYQKLWTAFKGQNLKELPTWTRKFSGIKIDVKPIPVPPGQVGKTRSGSLFLYSRGARFKTTKLALRGAIKKKAGKYGKPDLPYIIALNVLDWFDEDDVIEALIGSRLVNFSADHGRHRKNDTLIERDGILGPNKNRRVSAVLVGKRVSPWNIQPDAFRLYMNPWANKECPFILRRYTRALFKVEDEYIRVTLKDGLAVKSALGLPESWPSN